MTATEDSPDPTQRQHRRRNMTATSHHRGHPIAWDGTAWRFADGSHVTERPCPTCGVTAEPDGPDPCLGLLPGVSAACCGHGVHEPYAMGAS
jgi:hypothetical protein